MNKMKKFIVLMMALVMSVTSLAIGEQQTYARAAYTRIEVNNDKVVLGMLNWEGEEARKVIKTICDRNPKVEVSVTSESGVISYKTISVKKLLGKDLYDSVYNGDWTEVNFSDDDIENIKSLLRATKKDQNTAASNYIHNLRRDFSKKNNYLYSKIQRKNNAREYALVLYHFDKIGTVDLCNNIKGKKITLSKLYKASVKNSKFKEKKALLKKAYKMAKKNKSAKRILMELEY